MVMPDDVSSQAPLESAPDKSLGEDSFGGLINDRDRGSLVIISMGNGRRNTASSNAPSEGLLAPPRRLSRKEANLSGLSLICHDTNAPLSREPSKGEDINLDEPGSPQFMHALTFNMQMQVNNAARQRRGGFVRMESTDDNSQESSSFSQHSGHHMGGQRRRTIIQHKQANNIAATAMQAIDEDFERKLGDKT